jgi:hypothetical protein
VGRLVGKVGRFLMLSMNDSSDPGDQRHSLILERTKRNNFFNCGSFFPFLPFGSLKETNALREPKGRKGA